MAPRVVLASSSSARLKVLRAAGVDPDVLVPGVDEVFSAPDTAGRVCEIARVKGLAVRESIGETPSVATVLIAADTMLDIDGVSYGKPHDVDVARQRLHGMSGNSGVLYTGIMWRSHPPAGRGLTTWKWPRPPSISRQ